MRKFIIAATLTLTVAAFAQTGTQTGTSQPQGSSQGAQTQSAQPAQSQSAQPAAGQQQQKVIKDQTEYNDYITASGLTDPAQKAAALEAFVAKYPNSIMKEDALSAAMGSYQQAGN